MYVLLIAREELPFDRVFGRVFLSQVGVRKEGKRATDFHGWKTRINPYPSVKNPWPVLWLLAFALAAAL
jgi:hypothetical protein